MALFVKKIDSHAIVPSRATEGSVGYDLYSTIDTFIRPGETGIISTGIAVKVPSGTYGRIAPRSGLAAKSGIDVFGGVIDRDYTGEVKVILFNSSADDFIVKTHERVAQLIIEKNETPDVAVVLTIEDTVRGDGGFGSTGL